jgi:hypothetical protein
MLKKPEYLGDEYWAKLSPEHQALYGIVRPLPTAAYTVDWHIGNLERSLASVESDIVNSNGKFELEPDFQRGHVWTRSQQIAYVEAVVRKTAPTRLLFNCPGWSSSNRAKGDIPENTFQCVDGLQRLTALRKFLAGEFTIFNGQTIASLKGSPFDLSKYCLQMAVYEFDSRAELLRFYIDLNQGGTVHANEEIERIRDLLLVARRQDGGI